MVCQVADGAVVGSSLVDLLHAEWKEGRGADTIQAYVRSLKEATRP
jgi:tryptophan synthase alpha chain